MEQDLTLQELTDLMLVRVRRWMPAGVVIPNYEPPPLPPGLEIPKRRELEPTVHFCEHHPLVTLPIVLVVPGVRIYFESPTNWYYIPDDHFTTPYWMGPVIVQHDGTPPPNPGLMRATSVPENASALCQHHALGSLRSTHPMWMAQVFHLSGRIVGRMSGSGPGHHVTWAPKDQVPNPVYALLQSGH